MLKFLGKSRCGCTAGACNDRVHILGGKLRAAQGLTLISGLCTRERESVCVSVCREKERKNEEEKMLKTELKKKEMKETWDGRTRRKTPKAARPHLALLPKGGRVEVGGCRGCAGGVPTSALGFTVKRPFYCPKL